MVLAKRLAKAEKWFFSVLVREGGFTFVPSRVQLGFGYVSLRLNMVCGAIVD